MKTSKKTFDSQQTYLYLQFTDILKFYEVLFVHIVTRFVLSLRDIMLMLIFFCICKKTLPKLGSEKEL